MEGKFTKLEKRLELLAFCIIALATIVRAVLGVDDAGVLIIMVFAAVLMYIIFLVAAFFPADWRMTQKQKSKIGDREKYQATYRRVLVHINLLCSILFGGLIFFTC